MESSQQSINIPDNEIKGFNFCKLRCFVDMNPEIKYVLG